MVYDYLLFVSGFGAAVVIYLWLRDARIFFRTGLSGYRRAAYMGVLYSALGLMGLLFAFRELYFISFGLVLLALYMQGRIEKEKVWKTSSTAAERFFGKVPRQDAGKNKKTQRK